MMPISCCLRQPLRKLPFANAPPRKSGTKGHPPSPVAIGAISSADSKNLLITESKLAAHQAGSSDRLRSLYSPAVGSSCREGAKFVWPFFFLAPSLKRPGIERPGDRRNQTHRPASTGHWPARRRHQCQQHSRRRLISAPGSLTLARKDLLRRRLVAEQGG